MISKLKFALAFILSPLVIFSQAGKKESGPVGKKIKTLEVSDSIADAAVDRPGDFYVITRNGQFQKFNKDGELSVLYKTDFPPTLFEPRDGARLFAYYRDIQHYDYMSPSLAITASYRIDSAFVIQPWLMCTSGDNNLWVLDAADHSLKKINPKESHIEVEVHIDSALITDATNYIHMREYQNFIFILHPRKGIHIFNNLGHHIKTIAVDGLSTFHFLGEELYYSRKGVVHFFDLFTAESRELALLPGINGDILLTDERLFSVHDRAIDIYEFNPQNDQ